MAQGIFHMELKECWMQLCMFSFAVADRAAVALRLLNAKRLHSLDMSRHSRNSEVQLRKQPNPKCKPKNGEIQNKDTIIGQQNRAKPLETVPQRFYRSILCSKHRQHNQVSMFAGFEQCSQFEDAPNVRSQTTKYLVWHSLTKV